MKISTDFKTKKNMYSKMKKTFFKNNNIYPTKLFELMYEESKKYNYLYNMKKHIELMTILRKESFKERRP